MSNAPASQTRAELKALLGSRIPMIVIETRDEPHAVALIVSVALELSSKAHVPVFQWTVTDGLKRQDVDLGAQRHNAEPTEVLRSIRATNKAGIYVLLDFHPYLADPKHVRLLKDICLEHARCPRTLVLISHALDVPGELEHFAARFNLSFPDRLERERIVERVASEWQKAQGTRVRTDRQAYALLVDNLSGLSSGETERLARAAIFDDGALTSSDLKPLMQAKYKLLQRGGVLSFEYDTARFADLGGMRKLKQWLERRRPGFEGHAGLDIPKGVLLLGVQGCGKSVAARATAGVFGVPLLRLDFGTLHNKYIGETERNLRESLATAELMEPCVLWIDEIEKGLATSDSDGGTSKRVLGSFLTWLAEKKSRVFVVATANDISALPPELVRKGRFDEIFFVDLPRADARADILRLHATRRGVSLDEAEIRELSEQCSGFSGAEIEQAIVSACYGAHASKQPVTADLIRREMSATRPLSMVMAEQVAELRQWAAGRTVSAD
jgi:SpoVK/Ycf46/Vps4 family AAA+-type ATPase